MTKPHDLHLTLGPGRKSLGVRLAITNIVNLIEARVAIALRLFLLYGLHLGEILIDRVLEPLLEIDERNDYSIAHRIRALFRVELFVGSNTLVEF